MPRIAEIEHTPNPNARKFILREPLTFGVARSYENAQQAQGDDLATRLFGNPHVTNLYYVDYWLTVTQDGQADWPDLLREIAVHIREAPAAEAESQKYAEAAQWLQRDDAELSEADREKLEEIEDLLEAEVRPYLRSDGGDLYVVGLEDKQLRVHYQGACGSCPSSLSGTLSSIQGLVWRVDPELEVVAV
jgi:Fe-S cluster biogenesis protein NfuA